MLTINVLLSIARRYLLLRSPDFSEGFICETIYMQGTINSIKVELSPVIVVFNISVRVILLVLCRPHLISSDKSRQPQYSCVALLHTVTKIKKLSCHFQRKSCDSCYRRLLSHSKDCGERWDIPPHIPGLRRG